MECPPVDTLQELAAGRLAPSEGPRVRGHLRACSSCRLVLASARDDGVTAEMADTVLGPAMGSERVPPHEHTNNKPLPMPANIGRFVVQEILGSGAAGVVYAARDPELDRPVAIKLLLGSGEATPEQRLLLTKEAQAMAKVRHENVVTIYEAGVLDEKVFLVMELVDGKPLDEWLFAKRSSSEILGVFIQAGEGLASAHAAGIIHRDFKPANVFVANDGAVRVGDFGLARMEGIGPEEAAPSEIVGTPAYMPPEQFEGKAGSAQSDQFSFCASLYRALVGSLPHPGKGFAEIRASVLLGTPLARATDKLSSHQFAVLQRGMSTNPQDRYPSLSALLGELQFDPVAKRRKRRLVAAIAVVCASTVGGLAVLAFQTPKPALCTSVASHLSGVWDEGIKAQASKQFATFEIGATGAQPTFSLVRNRLDAYTRGWVSMRKNVCEATQVRGEQSQAVMQLQMDCLDRRLSELRELTLVVMQADGATILDRVVGAANDITPISVCMEVERLSEQFPMPEDAEERRLVRAVSDRLDRASILGKTGQYARARGILERLAIEAKATAYPPLEAEALYQLGVIQSNLDLPTAAEESLHAAIQVGARARHDVLVQKAWMELLQVVGRGQGRGTDAKALRPTIEAAMARTGDRPAEHARLLLILGAIASRSGEFLDAKALYEQALLLGKRELGEDSLTVAQTHQALGEVSSRLGDYSGAKSHLDLAMPALQRILGAKHPDIGTILMGMASNAAANGDNAQAEALNIEALILVERALGLTHRNVGLLRAGLADVQGRMGKYDVAEANYLLALEIYKNSPEDRDPDVAPVLNGLAILLLQQHKRREALPYLMSALAALQEKWPNGHPSISKIETNIGLLHGGLGDDHLAQEYCQRAYTATQGDFPKGSQVPLAILNCLATSALKLEEYAKARALFEQARNVGVNHPVLLAELEFGLAQTLLHTRGNRAEARRLATKARTVFASGGPRMEDSVLEVDTWLRAL